VEKVMAADGGDPGLDGKDIVGNWAKAIVDCGAYRE